MDKPELIKILRFEGFPERIIEAFSIVHREDFVPERMREFAYDNNPLPIGHGQTISQPSTIAFMLDQLELKDSIKILEVGCGCGYVLALIDIIVKDSQILGVEVVKELAELSRKNVVMDGNMINRNNATEIINTNGYRGLPAKKFDRIIVSAAAEELPKALINQLSDGGIAVIPVNNSIFKIRRKGKDFFKTEYPGFVFVPLIK
jgi:protein-L-isoaspartate(D-aspartate) O-methyltransferase